GRDADACCRLQTAFRNFDGPGTDLRESAATVRRQTMAMPNVGDIMNDVKNAASTILSKDVQTISGFSERQLKLMAQQAVWITEATNAGEFNSDPGLRDDFLHNLQDMAEDFAKALRGLMSVTVEKIWNATVDILWKAIEKGIGFALPRPI